MKKILFILSIVLVGCGYAPMNAKYPLVINKIKQIDNDFCWYYGISYHVYTMDNSFVFKDSTNKFQIGDTIRFCK